MRSSPGAGGQHRQLRSRSIQPAARSAERWRRPGSHDSSSAERGSRRDAHRRRCHDDARHGGQQPRAVQTVELRAKQKEQRDGVEQRRDGGAECETAVAEHVHQEKLSTALTSTVTTLTMTGMRFRPSA